MKSPEPGTNHDRSLDSERDDADPPYWLATAKLARPIRVTHVTSGGRLTRRDMAATEEPLQIRLNERPFAVIMRTPGADPALAAGFLLAERVVLDPGDIGTIGHHPDSPNVIDVTLVGRRAADVPAFLEARRQVITNSSCGVCGRVTIESLQVDAPSIAGEWAVPSGVIAGLPERLRASQEVFSATGGLHAAGLFDRTGRLQAHAEDVGRHNAVDKVLGRMLLSNQLPLDDRILFVSGRTSFEIVQKAFLAGVPMVAAVSAPSSLAVELAEETGITLLGFVRGEEFNVYTHHRRLADS